MGSRASTTKLFYPTISFTFCDTTFIAWVVNTALVILVGGLALGLKQAFEFRRRALG